jgi:hypothetical protein
MGSPETGKRGLFISIAEILRNLSRIFGYFFDLFLRRPWISIGHADNARNSRPGASDDAVETRDNSS